MSDKGGGWKNWGDHPLIVLLGSIAALVAIISFIQGQSNKATSSSTPPQPVISDPISPEKLAPTPSSVISPSPQTTRPVKSRLTSPPLIRSSTSLLSLPCTEETGTGASVYKDDKNVSISKQSFLSTFSMGSSFGWYRSSALLTCSLSAADFTELHLGFGRKDNDETQYMSGRGSTKITIFLDGIESHTRNVESGQKVTEIFKVDGIQSIAIEVVCVNKRSGCEKIYFFESSLK